VTGEAPAPPREPRAWIVRAAWLYVAILTLGGVVWMTASPPGIFSDSVSGFRVLQSMERGAAFNHTLVVDRDDIAKDLSQFTAWWTPGQYLAPWPFVALGLDLGRGMLLATVLAWVAGFAGWYLLTRRLGFSAEVAALSLAVIASQPYVFGWARFYHGGELLQWAFFPWFAVLAIDRRRLRAGDVLLLAAALIVGIVGKSSFLIVGAAALAGALWIGLAEQARLQSLRAVSLVLRAGVVLVLAAGALFLYTAAGESPAKGAAVAVRGFAIRELLFAAAAPLNSLFDLWQLYVPETESVQWAFGEIGRPLLLVVGIEAALLVALLRFGRLPRHYGPFVTAVLAVVVGSFALAYSLDLLISFHARHARVAGLLFVPGVIAAFGALAPRGVRIAAAALAAPLCAAIGSWALNPLNGDALDRPVGRAGFSHIYAEQAVIDAIDEIDAQLGRGNGLIAVPWPQLALEIARARVFDTRAALEPPQKFQYEMYFGRVDDLVVIAPAPDGDPAYAEILTRTFREHDGWRRLRPELQGYVFMYSGSSPDLR
jgi:hypothetical protein